MSQLFNGPLDLANVLWRNGDNRRVKAIKLVEAFFDRFSGIKSFRSARPLGERFESSFDLRL